MKHGTQVGLGPGQIALDADPPPPPPKGHSPRCPNFRHISVVAKGVDESRWHLASQPRRLCVRWGPSPPPQKGAEPPRQFSAHFSCGQTAAWIKMPLATEVGLGLDNIVLDGNRLHLRKMGRSPLPNYGPCLLWPNGWMDQDGTWHEGGPWSRPHCARWETSSLPRKRGQSPPQFSAHFYCRQTAG